MSNWLLPENLADILPAEARRIEEMRRRLLDLFRTYGFELVAPPLVEYLSSLLPESAMVSDLNLRTCKLVDQLSGRTLGVRADMTPQVARIDAHLLNREGVARLCYCGSVLHARPRGLLSDREQLQIGAEIYGHEGVEADIEIIQLALESIEHAGVTGAMLDLNHPGVFHAIVQADPVLVPLSDEAGNLLAAKDAAGLKELAARSGISATSLDALLALTGLYGQSEVLLRARDTLPDVPGMRAALDELEVLIQALPAYEFTIDLADMGSSFGYHSGATFSIYAQGWHDALVKGGRYDGLGAAYGRSRPATGFSFDLRKLSSGLASAARTRAIRAPWGRDPELVRIVRELRRAGEVVIQVLPGQSHSLDEFDVDREIQHRDGAWQVLPLA